jgi:hypothetical protein
MLQTVTNRHNGCLYYVSAIHRQKKLTIRKELMEGDLAFNLTFNFKYEAAIWNKRPIPLFSKPLLVMDLDDGTLQPSITKEEFSTLVELVLRDESIERLLGDDRTNDIFEKYDVLAVQKCRWRIFLSMEGQPSSAIDRPWTRSKCARDFGLATNCLADCAH